MQKYRMLRDLVEKIPGLVLHEAPSTTDGVLALAHDPRYVAQITRGELSPASEKEIGFPWSKLMVERSRRATGATIAACRAALKAGVAINLAGGTHHAHADRGEGFCVFNDGAVAARLMQAERRVQKVAIIDLDVHQGNGTASILANDESIFTFSMHGENNYPFVKAYSDLDIGLPDGAGDEVYLPALDGALQMIISQFAPQLIIYLSGADSHENDRLGRLKLTMKGLAERDALVFGTASRHGLPVAVTMGGGYGKNIEETVAIHAQTIRIAAQHAHGLQVNLREPAANSCNRDFA